MTERRSCAHLDRTAVIWDLEACREVLKLKNHGNNVNYVHLLPEDRHGLVLTSSLNIVKVWDTRSGICVKHLLSGGLTDEGSNEAIARDNSQLPPGETMIYRAATDADDKHLFTTYFNGVRMWDLEKLESVGAIVQNHK
jgi:WD40 repeat protein